MRGHNLWYEIRIRERCQLDPPHPLLEALDQIARHRQRQARLATPAGAGESQEAVVGEQLPDLGDLPLTPYKAREL
jgi:hypothetical protein